MKATGIAARADDPFAYSVGEVAIRFSISERTVRRLIASGTLPSVRAGRRRLVPHGAVRAWLSGEALV
jgi:excisionase family DNA binding protein